MTPSLLLESGDLTLTQGGESFATEGSGTVHVNDERAYLTDPRWWEPTRVNESMQAWADALTVGTGRKRVGVIPPGQYVLTKTVTFSDTASVLGLHVDAHGSEVYFQGVGPAFGTRTIIDQSDAASTSVRERWRWNGLYIRGIPSPASPQTGFRFHAAPRWVFDQCYFQNLDYGVDGRFCLHATFRDCVFQNNRDHGLFLGSGSGVWSGGGTSSSAGNAPLIDHCRFLGNTAATASLQVKHMGGAAIHDCTFEGSPSQCDVIISAAGNTSGLFNIMTNAWVEHATPNAIAAVKVVGAGHKTQLGFAHMIGTDVWVDATEGSGVIHVAHGGDFGLPAPVFNATGNTSGVRWVFGPIGTNARFNPFDPANWVGGNVPITNRLASYGIEMYATNRRTVTGSRDGNAALADLLVELAALGVIVDTTTA